MVEAILNNRKVYEYSLVRMLIDPRTFFKDLAGRKALSGSLVFAVLCSLLSAGASLLSGAYPNPLVMGMILFINAMGMIVISSGLGYMTMVILKGKKVSFSSMFSVYAFSSGVTLLFSWVTWFLWFTESWKWWLIYTGLKNTCGFTGKQAAVILVVSFAVQFFFLYSLYLAFLR